MVVLNPEWGIGGEAGAGKAIVCRCGNNLRYTR